jgi:lipopolysaccharide transport system permease protein
MSASINGVKDAGLAPKDAFPAPAAVPVLRIAPSEGWRPIRLRDLWDYRELLYFLIWREIRVRYKQTAIGIGWVLLQPLLALVIFAVVFGLFARMPSENLPYPLFVYAALVPWNYFSQAITRTANCLIGDANLIQKVYFPRMVIPTSSIAVPLLDLGLSMLLLLLMMSWYGVPLSGRLIAAPLLCVLAIAVALAMGLWLSALCVRYRDVGMAIPLLTQFLLYASPVAYPLSMIPDGWRFIYGLNPMVAVIQGFRWAFVGGSAPSVQDVTCSITVTVLLLLAGLLYFRQTERSFADVI